MVYRSINNEAPDYLSTLFERLSQNTIKELRNTKTYLKLPLLKASYGQKCFSYKEARLWNNLSDNIKKGQTPYQFKRFIKLVGNPSFNFIAFKIFVSRVLLHIALSVNFAFLYDCN